jgi:hypothetical protein
VTNGHGRTGADGKFIGPEDVPEIKMFLPLVGVEVGLGDE